MLMYIVGDRDHRLLASLIPNSGSQHYYCWRWQRWSHGVRCRGPGVDAVSECRGTSRSVRSCGYWPDTNVTVWARVRK